MGEMEDDVELIQIVQIQGIKYQIQSIRNEIDWPIIFLFKI